MKQSKGHLCFAGNFEFWQNGEEVYRAPIDNPIMTDGRRCGRFESYKWHFEHFKSVILEGVSK